MSAVVISGASRGIGRATALALAARGADLGLIARSSAELEETRSLCERQGVRAEIAICDLAEPAALERAAQLLRDRLGLPDVLVNNAAVIHRASVADTTREEWDVQLAVNLRAPFLLTRAFLPGMLSRGSGRIIHVASISATLGTRNAAAYVASKWGLVGFMKSLAEELSGTGLMTLAVLPGSVGTRMLEGSGFEPRVTVGEVASTVVHYSFDAALSHNGGIIEMFGV